MTDRALYLVRHGETEWTAAHRHNGRTDLPLSERGRAQARRLQSALAEVAVDHVFCSPLKRAIETARIALPGREVIIRAELTEWDYGEFEGRTVEEIRQREPEWTPWSHGFPGGETLGEVEARARRFLDELDGFRGPAIIFSHGHLLRILAVVRLELPLLVAGRLALDPAALSLIGTEYEQAAIRFWNRRD